MVSLVQCLNHSLCNPVPSVNLTNLTHILETSQTSKQLQHFIREELLGLDPCPCGHVQPAHLRREYMSSKLFCIGVPVTAHLALALSLHTAIEVWTLGFLILWASSNIIRAQATLSRGEQGDDPPWKKKQTIIWSKTLLGSPRSQKQTHFSSKKPLPDVSQQQFVLLLSCKKWSPKISI